MEIDKSVHKKGKGNQTHIPREKEDKNMKMFVMKTRRVGNGHILVNKTLSILLLIMTGQLRSGKWISLVLIHCFHVKSPIIYFQFMSLVGVSFIIYLLVDNIEIGVGSLDEHRITRYFVSIYFTYFYSKF